MLKEHRRRNPLRLLSAVAVPVFALLLALPATVRADAEVEAAAATESTAGGADTAGTIAISEMYDALRNVELDTSRSVRVENLQVGLDVMDIRLESGRLFFARPWKAGEKPTAAFWTGAGRVSFEPVNKLEKHEFKKVYKKGEEKIDEPISMAFIRFNDDLWDTLKDNLQPDTADPEIVRQFDLRQKALDDLLYSVEFPIIEDTISPVKRSPFRLVEFEVEGEDDWISYAYNPDAVEEHTLFRHKRVGFTDFQQASVLSIWHDRADYEKGGDLEKEDKDLFTIEHYDGDFTVLKAGLILDGKVRIDLTPRVDQLASARFSFITYLDFVRKEKEFKIREVTLPDGTPLDYIHNNYQLLVAFDRPVRLGETKSVVVSYTADFIRPNPSISDRTTPGVVIPTRFDALDAESKTFSLLNTFPWFPQYGFLKRYSIDWRLKVPKPFRSVASGTTVKEWEEGDYNCLHTVEKEKIALASWLFGDYQMYTDLTDTKRPRIQVWGLSKQFKQLKPLYDEARNIINWYEQKLTPFPYDELDIAQMGFFYGFGQAPPGLVQLTGETYLSAGEIADLGFNPTFKYAFVAHEIGHEWFGHVTSWSTSHDQWLSESYTEYMSGLYVADRQGIQAFDTKLRQWRERANLVPDGGSIWLGQRNGKWYQDVTYFKGPYVLHMLRVTMEAQFGHDEGDAMFFASMKKFLDDHRHQNATTTDLVQSVNQTTKMDFTGFFEQWFHDVGIPDITFTWESRRTEDGKYLVSLKAVQADGDNLKQMLLPVELKFGKGSVMRLMPITQKESVYQLKVPQSPDKVVPNPGDSTLANIKVEKG